MNYFCDLHIHSCLSPCGDNDMTPNNIVNMAVLCGYNLIAITDHNSIGNVAAAMKVAENGNLPITIVPGMELETSEEVHLVCLFPSLEKAQSFSDWLDGYRMPVKNRPEIFGEQLFLDENDEPTGIEERLLVTATACSVYDAVPKVRELGGAIYPAHVDRSSYSVISNLGFVPEDLGFTTVELSKNADKNAVLTKYPYLSEYRIVSGSDAHYLDSFCEKLIAFDLPEPTAEALIRLLNSPA